MKDKESKFKEIEGFFYWIFSIIDKSKSKDKTYV